MARNSPGIGAQIHSKLEAPSVAALLIEIGQRLTLAGENPYKARAYARAAESLLIDRPNSSEAPRGSHARTSRARSFVDKPGPERRQRERSGSCRR